MAIRWNKNMRRLHYWGAVVAFLPVLVIIATGVILQLKKDVEWIQPPSVKGSAAGSGDPSISFEQVLAAARSVPEAGVESWDDIDRLDVRPSKGIVKVRCKNRWEIQVDTATGDVLQVAYRRSDLIESIHDGSWFHDSAKLWIFLPAGVILLGLWLTGIYMVLLPWQVKRRRAVNESRRAERRADRAHPTNPGDDPAAV